MTSGRRDQLVTLQHTATTTQDEYGQEIPTWATLGTEWAAVYYGRGDERRLAARVEGQQVAVFNFLDNPMTRAAELTDRIILDGYIWDIAGISPGTPKRGEIEFTATRTGQLLVVNGGQFDFSDADNSALLILLEDA